MTPSPNKLQDARALIKSRLQWCLSSVSMCYIVCVEFYFKILQYEHYDVVALKYPIQGIYLPEVVNQQAKYHLQVWRVDLVEDI